MASVARITEISARSEEGFDEAVRAGIARANETLRNVKSAWVKDQEVKLDDEGQIATYEVKLKITFELE